LQKKKTSERNPEKEEAAKPAGSRGGAADRNYLGPFRCDKREIPETKKEEKVYTIQGCLAEKATITLSDNAGKVTTGIYRHGTRKRLCPSERRHEKERNAFARPKRRIEDGWKLKLFDTEVGKEEEGQVLSIL